MVSCTCLGIEHQKTGSRTWAGLALGEKGVKECLGGHSFACSLIQQTHGHLLYAGRTWAMVATGLHRLELPVLEELRDRPVGGAV